jgi:hypothetical protein
MIEDNFLSGAWYYDGGMLPALERKKHLAGLRFDIMILYF